MTELHHPAGEPKFGEWLPIESAPEGVRILVSYNFHGRSRREQVDVKEKSRGVFIWPSQYYDATGWMPLPEPPK